MNADISSPQSATQLSPVTSLPTPTIDRCRVVLLVLAVVLIVSVPSFLRMPLTNDAILFDLQARLLSEGDVLYREMLEPNFPGVVWLHFAVRWIGGASSEALRCFDLLLLTATLAAAYQLLRGASANRSAALWTITAAAAFYLGASEWIHCQRDTWMLAPIFVAGWMRCRAVSSEDAPCPGRALVEGLIWGCGVWIKPYVLLIGFACWITGLCLVSDRKRYVMQSLPLVAGGALAGALGIAWLMATGAWPHFVETLRVWNPQYLAAGRAHWTLHRLNLMAARFAPWFWLHLLAVPIALRMLVATRHRERGAGSPARQMLSAIYLTSLGHGFGLQHLFDYVHAPLVLLAILVTGSWAATLPQRRLVAIACGLFLILAVKSSSLSKVERLKLLPRCLTSSSTVELQDKLAHFTNPCRTDLEQVAQFLESRHVTGRDVGCFNSDCVWLYQRLKIHPPSRFIYVYENSIFFPSAHDLMRSELEKSGHKYVVSDLISCGMSRTEDAKAVGPAGPHAPPPKYRPMKDAYPWSHPVVFRAGSYLVHEVQGPLGKFVIPKK